jgi:hypothetical protein
MGMRVTKQGFTGFVREQISGRITIGAVGVVASTANLPDIAIARTGAGTYSVVFAIPAPDWEFYPGIKSAAGTIATAGLTAESPTLGTATLVTRNAAGAATDPANGDVIFLHFICRKYGVA